MTTVNLRGGLYGDVTPLHLLVANSQGVQDGPAVDTDSLIPRSGLSAAAGQANAQRVGATIATTSTTIEYVVAPKSGSLSLATITPLVALATHDTNYIAWTITNAGQAGAGTAVMLSTAASNTTKITGGSALAINTIRTLVLTATAADLVVVQGDLLVITATANGTLANTVTRPIYALAFSGTT